MSQDETTKRASPDHEWIGEMQRRVSDAIAASQRASDHCNVTAEACGADCACFRRVEEELATRQPNTTAAEREYTREEMREACRNNYNAGAGTTLNR